MYHIWKVFLLAAISKTVTKIDLTFLEPKLFKIQRGYISLKHPVHANFYCSITDERGLQIPIFFLLSDIQSRRWVLSTEQNNFIIYSHLYCSRIRKYNFYCIHQTFRDDICVGLFIQTSYLQFLVRHTISKVEGNDDIVVTAQPQRCANVVKSYNRRHIPLILGYVL